MKGRAIGKLLGAFGLLLLLTSPLTLLVTGGEPRAALVKAGVGALLGSVFLATHRGALFGMASRRATRSLAISALMVTLTLASLIALNVAAVRQGLRVDLTRERIFSLSPQTGEALAGLTAPVHVLAFLPAGDPGVPVLEELLGRYRALAPASFSFELRDPKDDPRLAETFDVREGTLELVLVRGEGEAQTHTKLLLAGSTQAEQELTNALLALDAAREHRVYFVVGHGEWPLDPEGGPAPGAPQSPLAALAQALSREGYQPTSIHLVGRDALPSDASLVVVAGARTSFGPAELALLERYLSEGGRLLFFAEAGLEPGLDALLAGYGIQVDPGLVADARFTNGNVYVPVTPYYGDHEITRPLSRLQLNVELPGVRALSLLRTGLAPGVEVGPLVLSSPHAWLESVPDAAPSPGDGEKTGPLVLVAAATRPVAASAQRRSAEARVVAFGDSELLLDSNWGHEPNRNLVLNAFAWSTSQAARVSIRPAEREHSTVDLDPAALARVRLLTADLLPLSLLGIGLGIWLVRRSR